MPRLSWYLRRSPQPLPNSMNRRQFLQHGSAALLLGGFERMLCAQSGKTPESSRGELVGVVPFRDEAAVPMGRVFGEELDARLYTDLSTLTPENLTTPTESFYIRTRASGLLTPDDIAAIRVGGLALHTAPIKPDILINSAKPMGTHLMECAGNARIIHFALMSVAEWSGVPLSSLIDDAKPKPEATRVLVSGFDTYQLPSRSSLPGASWIFTLDDIRQSGAFLATEMNGKQLTRDHGAPVRLVVPGWYGCTCIKWVNAITLIDDTAESTSQMQEFAGRTLQDSMPRLARDFQPAVIDQAAMPIRVEQWKVGKENRYRVVGILWGGKLPIKTLEIQFEADGGFVPVTSFSQTKNDPWSFWTHSWRPLRPGVYGIRLRVGDAGVQARRLNAGFYERSVEITEI